MAHRGPHTGEAACRHDRSRRPSWWRPCAACGSGADCCPGVPSPVPSRAPIPRPTAEAPPGFPDTQRSKSPLPRPGVKGANFTAGRHESDFIRKAFHR